MHLALINPNDAAQCAVINELTLARAKNRVENIKHAAVTAVDALAWLDTQGLKPLYFSVGRKNKPIITIEASSKCKVLKDEFGGVGYISRPGVFGMETVYRATAHGCFIDWVERGN